MTRPRIRTLKPELWQDEAVGQLGPWPRLLFIGLITMADDEGRLRAMPTAIAGHVFPYDEVAPRRLRGWLEEVAGMGLIELYAYGTTPYIQITGWAKHQKVYKATPSTLPPPISRNGSGKLLERVGRN